MRVALVAAELEENLGRWNIKGTEPKSSPSTPSMIRRPDVSQVAALDPQSTGLPKVFNQRAAKFCKLPAQCPSIREYAW